MSRRVGRILTTLGITICSAALLALAIAPTASATTTIGQLSTSPVNSCSGAVQEEAQATVTSGTPYVVPAGGQRVVSWSTNALAGSGQVWTMKMYRQISGTTYTVVGVDGPHQLTPSVVNTFPINIPVQPGDVLGFSRTGGASACLFASTGDNYLYSPFTDTAQGANVTFGTGSPGYRLNISAVIGEKASNSFSFGKVKKNKNNGTATLAVDVPGPGTLSLSGKGVKTQRAVPGATASKTVSAAGIVKLKVRAKGAAKFKLNHTGKVKVKVTVVFRPGATPAGDVAGDAKTEVKRIKLIKK
jgi:hypothetical protein